MKKPIKVFYSELSGRFYASQHYKQWPSGLVEITGAKYDVTDDIGAAVIKHQLEFTPVKTSLERGGDETVRRHQTVQGQS